MNCQLYILGTYLEAFFWSAYFCYEEQELRIDSRYVSMSLRSAKYK